jgi:hypothetical protein
VGKVPSEWTWGTQTLGGRREGRPHLCRERGRGARTLRKRSKEARAHGNGGTLQSPIQGTRKRRALYLCGSVEGRTNVQSQEGDRGPR